jgi:LAO/AO transport system kinase
MDRLIERIRARDARALARMVTAIENGVSEASELFKQLENGSAAIVGVTGAPGVGKSTLVDALIKEIRRRGKTVGILAVDPTSHMTGGAILGDRIRMQRHYSDPGVYIRSIATRGERGGVAHTTPDLAQLLQAAGFDYVLVETVGVGQGEIEIARFADVTALVLAPGMGDDIQAIKAGIMEIADIFVINKADNPGADRTQNEIRAALSLGSSHAPVLKTVAIDGSGAPALLDAIDAAGRKLRK